MSRKPLIAGNWKMNLNHFEAIALVQKIAFALPDKYFDKVDVTVIPPFTDLRSVQTLVDGDRLRLTYGAQDLSQHDSGAYTGEIRKSTASATARYAMAKTVMVPIGGVSIQRRRRYGLADGMLM